MDLPDGLTCHAVCEEVANKVGGLVWMRGKFNGWDHSWLEVDEERVVIDAYPWASSGPFMILTVTGSPWATLYQGEPACHRDV